jgi:hypothetical protein
MQYSAECILTDERESLKIQKYFFVVVRAVPSDI